MPTLPNTFRCRHCGKPAPDRAALNKHVSMAMPCRRARRILLTAAGLGRVGQQAHGVTANVVMVSDDFMPTETAVEGPSTLPPSLARVNNGCIVVDHENLTDEDSACYAQEFPRASEAGASFGTARTLFDRIRDDQINLGAEIWGPFADDDEWELAKWLIKNVGHNQAEAFLKLAMIQKAAPSYANKDQFLRKVDSLPGGVGWKCREIVQTGDIADPDGKPLTESLEVWYRDPVECIQELLGNPMFAKTIAYAPERVYRDRKGKIRRIDEMWTADCVR